MCKPPFERQENYLSKYVTFINILCTPRRFFWGENRKKIKKNVFFHFFAIFPAVKVKYHQVLALIGKGNIF